MKKDNKNIILYIIGILMLFVGLAVTTASTILIISHNIKSKTYIDTTAKVVDYDRKENGLRAIIVEYSIDEKFYQVTSNHYSNDPDKLDTEIKIKYNPKNHGEIIWIDNNRNGKYLTSGLILLVGDIIIWVIINLKDKNKKGSKTNEINDTQSITTIPQEIKTEEIAEYPIEQEPIVSTTPADGTIIIPIVEEEKNVEQEIPVIEKEEKVIENRESEISTPAEEKENPVKEDDNLEKNFEKTNANASLSQEEPPNIEEKKIEEVKELSDNQPLFEKEEIPEIFTTNNAPIEEIELPEVKEEKDLPTEVEMPKLNIPEIPYDMDSPRDPAVNNVLDNTMSIPGIPTNVELPNKKETKSLRVDKETKQDALAKLLDDLEKNS